VKIKIIKMKKLMSFLAVAVIVTGAFAFTPNKTAKYCISTTKGGACILSSNRLIVPTGGTSFFYDPNVTPLVQGDCFVADCVTPVRLSIN